eukprot:10138041-Heterocapsa_arctica.AAC.1
MPMIAIMARRLFAISSQSLLAPTCGVVAGLGCVRLVRHGLVEAEERDPPQPARHRHLVDRGKVARH